MRRRAALGLTAAALALGGCGGTAAGGGGGALASAHSGPAIFTAAGCAGCHTLAAAHSHGDIGPDLDQLRPSVATVTHQVINGGGGMPAFRHTLSARQIATVAAYVAGAARS